MLTKTWQNVEGVEVPMPAHQVLYLTAYILEAGYSMSTTQANEIQSMDQSELLNLWAGIGTFNLLYYGSWKFTFEGKILYKNKLSLPNKLTPLHGTAKRNLPSESLTVIHENCRAKLQ